MRTFIAFIRAVNVGGTGKLPMERLREMCSEIGFTRVQTYIASGNVVFSSDDTQRAVKTALEDRLRAYAEKPVGVVVRTTSEVRAILEHNPCPDRESKNTVAILLDRKPPRDALAKAVGRSDEEMRLGNREIYVYYGSGMGRSKLRIPAAIKGTARNMNTIAKMAELASKTQRVALLPRPLLAEAV
jgi:uncharacterized protein (DUF1697 family)